MFDDPAATDHGLPLQTAAGLQDDLQDDLMVASHDLDRLRTLLRDACTVLMASFDSAQHQLGALEATLGAPAVAEARRQLGHAVTALQFEDMASQLIAHTHRRLQACADRLAQQAMGDDGDGAAVVEAPPLRPNPVTQDEMDAGCVELF